MAYRSLRAIASALVLVGLGVGATSLGYNRWARSQQDIEKDVESLRADLDRVKRVSRRNPGVPVHAPGLEPEPRVVQGLVTPSGSAPAPQTSATDLEHPPPATPDEADYRAGVVIAANEKVLSDSYSIETRDPEWSGPAAVKLRSAYQGDGFEGVTTEVDCRSTLCRVDFSYDEGSNGEGNWRNMMYRMPWSGSGRATFNTDTRTGSFFIAREGHDLPNVDVAKLDY